MSLQKSPPSLPPEKTNKATNSAMDEISALEKSYRRQRWDYTLEETKGETVGLITGAIGAILAAPIVGFIWGGVVAGLVAALLTFLITLIVILSVFYVKAPKALDRNKSREIAQLQAEKAERDKHALIFEIDTSLESEISYVHDKHIFAPAEIAEPFNVDQYIIRPYLKIRFRNESTQEVRVEHMKLTLHRRGGGEEIIPDRYICDVFQGEPPFAQIERMDMSCGIPIKAVEITPHFWFHFYLEVSAKKVGTLNSDYFIRITMFALPPRKCSFDIDIEWESARNGSAYIFSQNVGSTPSS